MLKLQASGNILATALNSLTIQQQIRHFRFRKPPWVPRTKKTAFKIPPFHEQDRAEYTYMIPIHHNYRAHMRSVHQLFKTEAKFSDKESFKVREEKRIIFEKEQEVLKRNYQLNAETLKIQLVEEEEQFKEKLVVAELKLKEKIKLERLFELEAEEKVRKLKEKVKKFIDPNNLEFEIEKMLNERVDHNFSVDSSGRFFRNKVLVDRMQAFDQKFIPVPKSKRGVLSEETISAEESTPPPTSSTLQ